MDAEDLREPDGELEVNEGPVEHLRADREAGDRHGDERPDPLRFGGEERGGRRDRSGRGAAGGADLMHALRIELRATRPRRGLGPTAVGPTFARFAS